MIVNNGFAMTKDGNLYKKSNCFGTAAVIGCLSSISVSGKVIDTFVKNLPEKSSLLKDAKSNIGQSLKKIKGKTGAMILAGILLASAALDIIVNRRRAKEADKQKFAGALYYHRG